MSEKTIHIQVGDIVVLTSGSHPMVVEKVSRKGVFCVWSNGKDIKSRIFDAAMLTAKPTEMDKPAEMRVVVDLVPSAKGIADLMDAIVQASERSNQRSLTIHRTKLNDVLKQRLLPGSR